jgi:hypothetical protein
MKVNFVYVVLYGIFRFVTKVEMSLMSGFVVMIYVSFMLKLDAFYSPFHKFFYKQKCTLGLFLDE